MIPANLKSYIIPISDFDKKCIEIDIRKNSKESLFNYYMQSIDVQYVGRDGLRLHQTINNLYKDSLSILLYIIETYFDNDPDKIQQVVELHNSNLEYEAVNPPVPFNSKKLKTIKEFKVKKDKNLDVPVKKQKEKLKEIKFSLLKINFKKA